MQDVIQKQLTLQANAEKVYAAIADPKQVIQWFPNSLEGDYIPGSQPFFNFGENGKSRIYVVAARPHEYFAYRWVPGINHYKGDVLSVPTTLVEFTIKPISEGVCELTLTESGFSQLPVEEMADALKQNTNGWEFMLNRLTQMVETRNS